MTKLPMEGEIEYAESAALGCIPSKSESVMKTQHLPFHFHFGTSCGPTAMVDFHRSLGSTFLIAAVCGPFWRSVSNATQQTTTLDVTQLVRLITPDLPPLTQSPVSLVIFQPAPDLVCLRGLDWRILMIKFSSFL